MTAITSTPARRFHWRHLFQFRLLIILILTTVIALWLGWWSYKARQQRTAIESFGRAADIRYDFQMSGSEAIIPDRPHDLPIWLVDFLGVDYFANVIDIIITDSNVNDSDLKNLECLDSLVRLDIRNTSITESGVARLQKALPHCKIQR